MMNNVSLVGRLTKDIDLRYTSNGTAVGNFTLAVNKPFKNQSGEQEADFIRCVIWRKSAEAMANYTSKGSMVSVSGSIETGSYDDNDGKRVYTTEVNVNNVQFLDSKKDSGSNQQQSNYPSNQPVDISDDSLPF
ncbi:MAG: single-stranded DNA-binding protein [Pisciglobus halotolerans]|nr:single-stranded DNA-binding protein [Pisciglobus halotolerans]